MCADILTDTLDVLGMILTAQTVMYTVSKFFASWATDHYSPRLMFTGGMFLSGFVMLAFSGKCCISGYELLNQLLTVAGSISITQTS